MEDTTQQVSCVNSLRLQACSHDIHDCFGLGMSFEEANEMMTSDPEGFKAAVQQSLRRHLAAVQSLRESDGLLFFDYGNAFLLECHRAGCDVDKDIPSYVGEASCLVLDVCG